MILAACLFAGWTLVHTPAIFYGTENLPLHMSYIGDEQSPVNGALHILADKSLLALRDLNTVYYGPVFSLIALPAVLLDFMVRLITGAVSSIADYTNFILWNWGGIVIFARLFAVAAGFLGLVGLFKLLSTKTFNPFKSSFLPIMGTVVLATNFFYFEYASFFKHWIFICTLLLWQLYYAVKIFEDDGPTKRYWVYEAVLAGASFGVSYLSLVFQIIWAPLIFSWWKTKNNAQLKKFFMFIVWLLVMMALIVWWHPHAFERILGLTGGDIANTDTTAFTAEAQAAGFSYVYYGLILLKNNLPLIVALIVLAIASFNRKIYKNTFLWVMLLPLFVYATIFGTFSHHESRYVLPVLIFLITLVFFLAGQIGDVLRTNRIIRIEIASLLVFYLAFNVAHLGKWLSIMHEGPQEQVAIKNILALEKETPNGKTLFKGYYLLGHVHTREAYRDYAERFKKSGYNLYQAIDAGTPPVGVPQLRTYYSRPDEPMPKKALSQYAHIIYRYEPKLEQNLDPDFMEVDLTRLWFYKDFADRYTQLK
jgi:hypothetical protein